MNKEIMNDEVVGYTTGDERFICNACFELFYEFGNQDHSACRIYRVNLGNYSQYCSLCNTPIQVIAHWPELFSGKYTIREIADLLVSRARRLNVSLSRDEMKKLLTGERDIDLRAVNMALDKLGYV